MKFRKSTSDYDREKLQERFAKLAGGIAQINVGAASEAELKENAKPELKMHCTQLVLQSKKALSLVVA